MSVREDLAGLIWTTSREDESTISGIGAGYIADVLLAAGWRPPARKIETAEELEALAEGSIVCDADDLHFTKDYGDWYMTREEYPDGVLLPATVLWEPEAGDE